MPNQINTFSLVRNCTVLGNAAAFVAAVVCEMGDKDITPQINDENLSRSQIEQLALNRLSETL